MKKFNNFLINFLTGILIVSVTLGLLYIVSIFVTVIVWELLIKIVIIKYIGPYWVFVLPIIIGIYIIQSIGKEFRDWIDE